LTDRELNPNVRVVIRMFDQKMAKKIEKNLGIHGAYSSSARLEGYDDECPLTRLLPFRSLKH
jgi:hypothetical protein